jgi:hypothetical protein
VDFALQPHVASEEPWSGALRALGFDPSSAVRRETPEGPQYEVKAGRVPLVRDAWKRVTLRRLEDGGELLLEPSETSELRPALAEYARSPDAYRGLTLVGSASGDGGFEVRIPSGRARALLLRVLAYAGVPWPAPVAKDDFAALKPSHAGPLLVAAERSPGFDPGWTWVLAGPADALPDLTAFGFPPTPRGETVALPDGAGLVTMPLGGKPPASEATRLPLAEGREVLAFGLGARTAAARAVAGATDVGDVPNDGARPAGRGPDAAIGEARIQDVALRLLLESARVPRELVQALPLRDRYAEGEKPATPPTSRILLSTDGTRVILRTRHEVR